MVVESGPVEYADQEHDDVDDDEDEDDHFSAAQLMGQEYGHGESCGSFSWLLPYGFFQFYSSDRYFPEPTARTFRA
jgi:hypothetical protein